MKDIKKLVFKKYDNFTKAPSGRVNFRTFGYIVPLQRGIYEMDDFDIWINTMERLKLYVKKNIMDMINRIKDIELNSIDFESEDDINFLSVDISPFSPHDDYLLYFGVGVSLKADENGTYYYYDDVYRKSKNQYSLERLISSIQYHDIESYHYRKVRNKNFTKMIEEKLNQRSNLKSILDN